MMPVMGSLIGQLVYGAVVGAISTHSSPEKTVYQTERANLQIPISCSMPHPLSPCVSIAIPLRFLFGELDAQAQRDAIDEIKIAHDEIDR